MSKREKSNDLGWVDYIGAKKRKLLKQFNEEKTKNQSSSSEEPQIFQGVAIYVNGFTNPSADELKMMMMKYGGRYDQYYRLNSTTHIIANNLPHAKIKQLKKQEKVVKPEWITDSIAARKLLPCSSYELYRNQERICFDRNGESNFNDDNDADSKVCSSDDTEVPSLHEKKHSTSNETRMLRAGEDNFLKEFYGHSRLHHISTAGAKFKDYVNTLRKNHNGVFSGRSRLREWKQFQENGQDVSPIQVEGKIFMHLDMDCFFVSAGLRNQSHLRGLPVAVAHSRGGEGAKSVPRPAGSDIHYELNHYGKKINQRHDGTEFGSLSAISSCNYEARTMGVRNGMMLGEALKLCPGLKTIPYDFQSYEEISQILYDTVTSYTLEVQAVSCDELFIDCTDVLRETSTTPLEFSSFLRNEVYEKTSCTASAGMAENVLLARLATKKVKPNGQLYLQPDEVNNFIMPHLVKELPGVGYSLRQRLENLGIVTCGDLQKCSLEMLQKEFGPKMGLTLYRRSRGNEDCAIQSNMERKSVSAEVNYGIRFENDEEVAKFLRELSEEVSQRIKSVHKKGRNISLKLKVRKKDAPVETAKFMGHGICDNITRSTSVNIPTDSSSVIATECIALLKKSGIAFKDLRGIGIQVGRLDLYDNQHGSITNYLNESGKFNAKHRSEKGDVKTTSHYNLPKASELDATVLSALPADIRQEILEAYTIGERPVKSTDDLSVTTEELPDAVKSMDLHASELDESIVNALPPEIRQEIVETYNISKLLRNKTHRAKESEFCHEALKNTVSNSELDPNVVNALPPDIRQEILETYKISKPPENEQSGFSESEFLSSKEKGPNLCGAECLEEVKELLSEWIGSTDEPADVDVEVCANYLEELLVQNLEKTDLVLKYFYRQVGKKNAERWKVAYSTVVSTVQIKMRETYGNDLKVSNF